MKEFTIIYSTKAIANIQYSFKAEDIDAAIMYASEKITAFPNAVIVENFEASKANEGVIVWANGAIVK